MNVTNLLQSIPDVVWSGVIASALTLSGVFLSNWSNTSRLKLQLEHESTENEKDRRAELRTEVYLQAAQELTKANSYLASLAQVDLSKTNPAEGLKDFFAIAAKLQLIAEAKTSFQIGDLVALYGELLIKSIVRLTPIQDLKTHIAIKNDHYGRCQAEISRILAAMTQYNESAQHNEAVFVALQRSFELQQNQALKVGEERDDLLAQHSSHCLNFTKELIAELKQVAELQVPLMVALRRELELDGDANEFAEQMEKIRIRMEAQLDAAFNHFKNT